MTQPTTKPPITCHVLDTSIGRPAANIPVTLTLHPSSPSSSTPTHIFTSVTNSDGRITAWTSQPTISSTNSKISTPASVADVVKNTPGDQKWGLTFDVGKYFDERGIEAFYPDVEVRFWVKEGRRGEHFHVPVLLGPWGWSTYRGS